MGPTLIQHGTDAQKRRYLTKLLAAEELHPIERPLTRREQFLTVRLVLACQFHQPNRDCGTGRPGQRIMCHEEILCLE